MKLIPALQLSLDPARPDVVACVGGGGKSSTLFRLAREVAQAGKRAIVTSTTRISPTQVDWAPACVLAPGDELPLAAINQALDTHGQCLLVSQITAEKVIGLAPALVDQLVAAAPTLQLALVGVEADGAKWLPAKAPAAHEPVLPASTTLLMPVIGMDTIGAPIDEAHVHRPELVRRVVGILVDEVAPRLTPAQAARLLIDPQGGAKSLPHGARLLPLLNKAETTPHQIAARLVAQRLLDHHQPCLIGAVGLEPAASHQLPATRHPPPATNPILERWAPITAVVLAAGQSRRLGQPKQLAIVDGEPMVVRAIRVAQQSGANEVLVITGAYADRVTDALAPLQKQGNAIRLVYNSLYESGQASSIRTAVQALAPTCRAALFLPVDQPFVPPVLLQRLIRVWRQGAPLAAAAVNGQVRGAPALFDHTLWLDLLVLEGDIGARPLLQRYRDRVVAVSAAESDLRDIDTPEDLVSAIGRCGS